jgi:hypothetical protein
MSLDPDERILGGPGVFFVPEYERFWYLGLAGIEHAAQSKDARAASIAWERAERQWAAYLSGAEKATPPDPWLPIARAHLAKCRAERLNAQKRAGKLPPPPPEVFVTP